MASSSIPAQQSKDLFNRINAAGLEDSEKAMQCAFQLRTLHRQGRLDFTGRVALAMALLIVGERDEALDQIGSAYAMRDRTDLISLDALATLLTHVAEREKALRTSREVFDTPGLARDPGFRTNAALVAAWAGDIDYLRAIAERDQGQERTSPAPILLRVLKENGLLDHFPTIQRMVTDIVKNVQMHAHTTVIADDAGGKLIATLSYIDGTRTRRRDIEQPIDAALLSYCRLHGLDEDALAVIVTEAPRHPSLGGIGNDIRAA